MFSDSTTLLIGDKRDLDNATCARTFAAGIKQLQTKQWDFLYLDYDLGGLIGADEHGMAVLRWLKDNPTHRPQAIYLVSSYFPAVLEMRKYCEENMPEIAVTLRELASRGHR